MQIYNSDKYYFTKYSTWPINLKEFGYMWFLKFKDLLESISDKNIFY